MEPIVCSVTVDQRKQIFSFLQEQITVEEIAFCLELSVEQIKQAIEQDSESTASSDQDGPSGISMRIT